MFADLVDRYVQLDAAALDAAFREHELEDRRREAHRLAMLVAIEARQVAAVDGHRSTRSYLKATTNTSGGAASALVHRARTCRDLPTIGDALQAGHIGVAQVDALSRAHRHPRVGDRFGEAVDVFVNHAEHFPLRDLQLLIDRWIAITDARGAFDDLASNIDARDARVIQLGDVLDVAVTGGDPITADYVKQVFDGFVDAEYQRDVAANAVQYGPDATSQPLLRTTKQRRFDAFVAMVRAAQAATQAGLAPAQPHIVVNLLFDQRTATEFLARNGLVFPDGTVFDPERLTDAEVDDLLGAVAVDPESIHEMRCETESGHPVHPVLAVRALLTEHIRRVVVNSQGTRIDFGRESRLFTGNARLAARLLAPHCEHPGCDVCGTKSDIDHNIEWSNGGQTAQLNANVLHPWHNRFKIPRRLAIRPISNLAGILPATRRHARAAGRRTPARLVRPAHRRSLTCQRTFAPTLAPPLGRS